MAAPTPPPTVRHIVIDMQRLFAEDTPWHAPSLATILPNVTRLGTALRSQTLFARFIVPATRDQARGRWQTYYGRWSSLVGAFHDPALHDLVEPLRQIADENRIFDKHGYSAFTGTGLHDRLAREGVDTLIFSGVETDVCVYSSVLAAIDLGYHVILASDALASGDDGAHRTVLETLAPRLPEQITVMTTDEILATFGREVGA